jgi:hypothetical protein
LRFQPAPSPKDDDAGDAVTALLKLKRDGSQEQAETTPREKAVVERPADDELTPFAFVDDSGLMTHFLIEQGHEPATRWLGLRGGPGYHIDVHATADEKTDSRFLIKAARFHEVRVRLANSENLLARTLYRHH